MDVQEYVAARYGRLLERAFALGAPEGLASEYVDQVLLDQRRAISRADDPDPVVYEALERAINGEPARRSWFGPSVALGLVVVGVVAAVALTYEPPHRTMPSLFGYNGEMATAVLEEQGYGVVLRESRACEPVGLVLSTQPAAGEEVAEGATVSVSTAVPSGTMCQAEYQDRADAWEFIAFTLQETSPEFTETVNLIIDGSPVTRLSGVTPWDDAGWAGPRRLIAEAAAATGNGMARLSVSEQVPPASTCGVSRPESAGDREVLRLQIDTRLQDEDSGCPLTVDLYRSDRVIDSVVIYRAEEPDST